MALGDTRVDRSSGADPPGSPGRDGRPFWRLLWDSARTHKNGAIGLVLLLAILLFISVGPFFTPSATDVDTSAILQGPSLAHPFGTDELGREVLARVAEGGRQSYFLALTAVVVGLAGGIILGTFGPYRGGAADRVVVVILDSFFSFPAVILAMVILVALGAGVFPAGIAVGVAWIPYFGRIIRGQVLTLRQRPYVQAAKAAGSRSPFIVFRHILPNTLGPIIVISAFAFSGSMLLGSGLGFLGLGAKPPLPEWGSMVGTGRSFLSAAPWIAFFPGAFIVLTSLGANLLGDGLQDILDPRRVRVRKRR